MAKKLVYKKAKTKLAIDPESILNQAMHVLELATKSAADEGNFDNLMFAYDKWVDLLLMLSPVDNDEPGEHVILGGEFGFQVPDRRENDDFEEEEDL